MTGLEIAVAAYCAYLVGSFSSAIVVCRVMGLPDPRTQGSGNPGATNVLRVGGKKAAALTLFGDLLKGLLPVLVAIWYGFGPGALAIIAFCAFLGHLFPIFFRFEGGKGVATALGTFLGLAWPVGLAWIATWAMVAFLSRYSSLAALVASALTPLYFWFFTHNEFYVDYAALIALSIFLTHYRNIRHLAAGTEAKFGDKDPSKY